MELKSIHISRQENWASLYPGEFAGKIVLTDPTGEVTVNLTPERCAEICAIIAEGAKETARKVCDAMMGSLRRIGPLALEDGLDEAALIKKAPGGDDDLPF